jgi:hypothetical protein
MASTNESPPREQDGPRGETQTKAAGLGGEAQQKATDVAGQAQEKTADVAGQVKEKSQQAAGSLQDRLREQLGSRSTAVGEQVDQQASDLRSVGESLREQGKSGPARAANQLADYAEKVGGYLREKDPDALLADAERFGRRQPWAVTAGGLVLGFAASRVLKASSGRRYRGSLTVERPAGVYPSPSTDPAVSAPGGMPGAQEAR